MKYEILKIDKQGNIITIKLIPDSNSNIWNRIISVGDIIQHYNNNESRIISFKKNDDDLLLNYDLIRLSKNWLYPKSLRKREKGRHWSSISNINGVIKRTQNTIKIEKKEKKKKRNSLIKYKVLVNYPYSLYNISSPIIIPNDRNKIIKFYKNQANYKKIITFLNSYPKIFKKII